MTEDKTRGIEPHAQASNGEYYIYRISPPTGLIGEKIDWLGPFFPTNRRERIEAFVANTQSLPDNENWKGAYYRRLPQAVRDAVTVHGPAGRIARSELARLAAVNSLRLPVVVNDGGRRKRWVGISWVDEGPATGRETEVVG